MATKKTNIEVITIAPVEKVSAEITIVGESPLIVHAWSEKSKERDARCSAGQSKG